MRIPPQKPEWFVGFTEFYHITFTNERRKQPPIHCTTNSHPLKKPCQPKRRYHSPSPFAWRQETHKPTEASKAQSTNSSKFKRFNSAACENVGRQRMLGLLEPAPRTYTTRVLWRVPLYVWCSEVFLPIKWETFRGRVESCWYKYEKKHSLN